MVKVVEQGWAESVDKADPTKPAKEGKVHYYVGDEPLCGHRVRGPFGAKKLDSLVAAERYGAYGLCQLCGKRLVKQLGEKNPKGQNAQGEEDATAKDEVLAVEGKDMFEVIEGMDIVLVSQEMSGSAIMRECVVMWTDKDGVAHYELNYNGIKQLVRSYEEEHATLLQVEGDKVELIPVPDPEGVPQSVWSASAYVKDMETGRRLPGYADVPAYKTLRNGKVIFDKFARRAAVSLAIRNAYKQHLPMAFVELFIKEMAAVGRVLAVDPPWKGGGGGGTRMEATAPKKPRIPEKSDEEVRVAQLRTFHGKWRRMLAAVAEQSGVVSDGDAVNMKRAFAASLTLAVKLSFADMGPGDLMAASKELDEKWERVLNWLATGRYVDTLAQYSIPLELENDGKDPTPTAEGPAAPDPNTDEVDVSGPTREELERESQPPGPPLCLTCAKQVTSKEVDASVAVNMPPYCTEHLAAAVMARMKGETGEQTAKDDLPF